MTAVKLPLTVQHEFNDLMFGPLLGSGSFRSVYVFLPDPTKVIKVEIRDSREFENVSEWVVWNELCATKWAAYLAPCSYISHSGSVLIQDRTHPITELPAQVPNFMTDLKLRNFGRLGERIVAHDYGHHKLFSRSLRSSKLVDVKDRTADWG